MVTLLRCLLEMNCSVLLTTNTHSALDNVLSKLRKVGLRPLRHSEINETTVHFSTSTRLKYSALESQIQDRVL